MITAQNANKYKFRKIEVNEACIAHRPSNTPHEKKDDQASFCKCQIWQQFERFFASDPCIACNCNQMSRCTGKKIKLICCFNGSFIRTKRWRTIKHLNAQIANALWSWINLFIETNEITKMPMQLRHMHTSTHGWTSKQARQKERLAKEHSDISMAIYSVSFWFTCCVRY